MNRAAARPCRRTARSSWRMRVSPRRSPLPTPTATMADLELDFPGLRIGVAEYDEGPTGCTVFHFTRGATIERGVRGGSPGTFGEFDWVVAICFAGGSLYGLESATGVAAELFAPRGCDTGWMSIVAVAGAIVDRDGRVARGHYDAATGARRALVEGVEERVAGGRTVHPSPGNTTLTLVATNQRIDRELLRKLARQVHASMARAIHPFHALTDGDVLFAVTTNEVDNDALDSVALGVVASELAWDAVLAAVR